MPKDIITLYENITKNTTSKLVLEIHDNDYMQVCEVYPTGEFTVLFEWGSAEELYWGLRYLKSKRGDILHSLDTKYKNKLLNLQSKRFKSYDWEEF